MTDKKASTKKPATANRNFKILRNLRNCPVHLRLTSATTEKPYRVELKPRGTRGDVERVPKALVDTEAFQEGFGRTFEVITQTELDKIEYPPIGYIHQNPVQVIRPQDRTVMRAPDYDGKTRKVPTERNIVPREMRDSVDPRLGPAAPAIPGAEIPTGSGEGAALIREIKVQ